MAWDSLICMTSLLDFFTSCVLILTFRLETRNWFYLPSIMDYNAYLFSNIQCFFGSLYIRDNVIGRCFRLLWVCIGYTYVDLTFTRDQRTDAVLWRSLVSFKFQSIYIGICECQGSTFTLVAPRQVSLAFPQREPRGIPVQYI